MKIKPTVLNKIHTKHTSFEVDITLDYNVTFICGESGVGKSALYSLLEELAAEDKRIRCFNYLDKKKRYKNSIKQSKEKLFVIDNADILLDDSKNQYIIIGRNPTGLVLSMDEIYELNSENKNGKTLFSLRKQF